MLRTVFSTSTGAAVQEELGVRGVAREDVQQWRDSDAGCVELVTFALEKLESQSPGASFEFETFPFVMIRVGDYPVLVAQGWRGHLTPAVILKGRSPNSHKTFAVAN